MSVTPISAETITAARESLHRGELTLTLVAKEGERFLLRDLATLCRHFNGLITEVMKEVEPKAKVEWCVTALAVTHDQLAVTIGGFPPRKRGRKP